MSSCVYPDDLSAKTGFLLARVKCRRGVEGLGSIRRRSRDAGAIAPTVESVCKLVKIEELLMGASAPVKWAINHRFRVADSGIDPPEHMCGLGIVTAGHSMIGLKDTPCPPG
ncbi:MAG: hypothetical protein C7B43_03630 [Sulfobacillus benefaciens]|uniref:Uncharacterized protein n=1 Tax=Sulfobacillus benefaciens TaxID=453960 RepID=A0A2T2X8Z2_9FIRM|nr:MAG: hypothetical protein C7B43_03630 [Sulfobacillus benefaciens]